jgi:ABC-2 type transport system permease protein
LIGSLRSEWLRLTRRPAVWILALVLLAILLALSYALMWIINTFPPPGVNAAGTAPAEVKAIVYPASWLHTVLGNTTGLGGAVALILGVLVTGSEYTWGTVKTMVTQGPGRFTVLAGKVVAMEVAIAILAVAILAAGAGASAVLVTIDAKTSPWPDALHVLGALAAAWLIMSMYAGLGFVLGVLFRQAALAVGIGLVYMLVIESLVLNLLGSAAAFRSIVSAFPGSNANALIASFWTVRLAPGGPAIVGVPQAIVVLAAYTGLFGGVSALVFRVRDIS